MEESEKGKKKKEASGTSNKYIYIREKEARRGNEGRKDHSMQNGREKTRETPFSASLLTAPRKQCR
jgi:hypothetical protein